MSLVHLETPVLVQQRNDRFRLQPLLMPGPCVERKRYRDAEQALRKAIIEEYKERALERSEMDELLWLSLNEGLRFELMPLAFKSGLHHIEGLFALVRYRIRGRDYLCLPRLEQLTVQLPEKLGGRGALIGFVEETVREFLRKKRKEQEGDPLDHRPYLSEAGDSLVDVSVDLQIKNNPYPFEWESRELFSLMGRDEPLDAAEELTKVAEDWNDRHPGGLQTALFREALRQRLHLALYGKHPTPTVLVAPTGSGKTNLVQDLVKWHIQQGPQRPPHRRVKLWLVDPLRVISGMSIVGQWERRWETILERLCNRLLDTVAIPRPDILYVDNPVALLHIGKSSQTKLTLAHLVRPYLEERRLPCLLEATPQQWQRIQELDRGFADLFQVIRLPALNAEQQLTVILSGRSRLENERRCRIETEALTTLLKLEPQFRGDQALPGSALGPLAQIAQRHQEGTARAAAVYDLFQTNFHFRRGIIERSTPLSGKEIDRFFHHRLVGQPAAHDALRDLVLKIKARLTPPGKPLSSLLLIGPTGVGKTESAKLLTEYLFEREECLVRIDLNEFADEGAVARLIGNNANPNGILTERVRYQRACVLLLDELEKAHPKVHDLLLQLLDDGRLTDALGRTTDFGQTVVVMTSNLGAREAARQLGFSQGDNDRAATYRQAVERFFRPEFLNRIDKQVAFDPLRREHMKQLAALHLGRLIQRDGFVRRNTILNLEADALERLSDRGFERQMGARALKRYLEQRITSLTAEVLATHVGNQPVILRLHMQDGELKGAIKALQFAPRREAIEPADYSLDDYHQILRQLRQMDEALTRPQADRSPDHAAWILSGKLRDIVEPLQSFIWDMEERRRTRRLQIRAFRPKASRWLKDSWRGSKLDCAALFAQSDIRDYLNGLYQTADACFTREQCYQAQLQTELRWLQMAYRGHLDRTQGQGGILIRSLLPGQGHAALAYLADNLRRLINDLGSVEAEEPVDDGILLQYQGPGLDRLASSEQGIHLFIEENNAQLPIAVIAMAGTSTEEPIAIPDTIIRLYALPRPEVDRRDDTVTDLRSGMQCGTDLELEDLKLLVAAGLPEDGASFTEKTC
jgi:ATP-dependent Clp protease ATP-binding subunit ClpC